jgi:ribonuclease HI
MACLVDVLGVVHNIKKVLRTATIIMAKKKFYAVAEGRKCGIFDDWPTAERQVKGYGGAKYKSFSTEAEARQWLNDPVYTTSSRAGKKKQYQAQPEPDPGTTVVYTDGGAINNPGPGGYGIVIDTGTGRQELSGGYRLTTNNRMEMMAAIVALRELQGSRRQVLLYSDSSYLVNGIEKGWAMKWRRNGWRKSDGKPVLNIDLWQELLSLLGAMNVRFIWVKGHAGNELNERCDRMAVSSARKADLPADPGYEQPVPHEGGC